MRLSLLALPVAATLVPLVWTTQAAAAQDGCTFSDGVTTCSTVTTEPVGEDVSSGSTPQCTLITPITAVTTSYTAHRGHVRSSGTQLPAPDPTVTYERGTSVERCVEAPEPSLTSRWWHAPDGNLFFQYEGRNLQPNTPVEIAVTFTNADGRTQTFTRSLTTFDNGFFGTGDQFHCDFQSAVSITATQGDIVLTASGAATDPGACTA